MITRSVVDFQFRLSSRIPQECWKDSIFSQLQYLRSIANKLHGQTLKPKNYIVNYIVLSYIIVKNANDDSYNLVVQILYGPELRLCAGSNPARGVSEFALVRIPDNGRGWK